MSTDQIFASQMWNWADPMLKRDSHGRILIVNAAFLQLYGGAVENWTGNPIQGWPNPKNPGEVSKFESRIPLPTGGETVYDWLECTAQDGTALAMARDVTSYAQVAAPMPFPQPEIQATPAPVEAAPIAAQPEPVQSAPVAAAPVAAPVIPEAPAPVAVQPVAEIAQPVAAVTPAPAPAPAPVEDTKPAVVAPLPISAPPVLDAAPSEERDFERRALPIENGDAILGNNWRDAVIAKAVGVEDSTQNDADAGVTPPTVANQKADGEPIRVLLAEDNAINALLTRTLLEAEGCHCDVVEDGVLAVEAVKNKQYDMVFMDMRMPNMDGLEATRKIRAMGYNEKTLPIVALTANAFDDDRNACFDSGMNDFMTKPVSAEELSAMVNSHTGLEAQKIAS